MSPTPIADYDRSRFTATMEGRAKSFDIYTRGEGPPVVVIQELPGIGQETLHLADELVRSGFQVTLPHLFGPIGRTSLAGNLVRVLCMRREFALFAANRTSPVVEWLAALCRDIKNRTGYPGVGTIGMCLTGNFAISLMADDAVLAGVASQPSMPIAKTNALHMSDDDVACISDKLDKTGPMLSYRFKEDTICRAGKFEALDKAFNQGAERIRLRTLPGPGHSVFTLDFVDEAGHPTRDALDDVVAYFRESLAPA